MKTVLFFICLCITGNCTGQNYEQEIDRAERAYEKNQFDSCAYYFRNAFNIKQGQGSALYNAGVCNALNNNYKQAFVLLRLAVTNGANVSKLKIDPELESLHNFKQWRRLVKYASKIQEQAFKKTLYPQYAALLAKLWEKDQYYRFRMGRSIKQRDTSQTNALWKKMRIADSVNATIPALMNIIDKIGWPTTSKVGKAGAQTAFLIIDHSPREVMEKYFPSLEEAAQKGEAPMANFATMNDRILVNRGKKQIYGTQSHWDEKEKKFVYFPIEDEKNVNQKRKQVGLDPLPEFNK